MVDRETIKVLCFPVVFTLILALPRPADALVAALKNVRDSVQCAGKAVLNPLKVFKWGVKNFKSLSSDEYDARANQTFKEVQEDCRRAARKILARGFGLGKLNRIKRPVGYIKRKMN